MNILFASICATLLYVFITGYLVYNLVQSKALSKRVFFPTSLLSLVLHGINCYQLIVVPGGLSLGFFTASSLIFLTVNTIVFMSHIKKPVHNLFLFLLPLSVLSIVCAQYLQSSNSIIPLSIGIASHILLSIVAYSLLTIASFKALFLAYQNYLLKQKKSLSILKLLPPLQTIEALLFEMLMVGQIFLTLSIISGAIFLNDIFAQHVAHKTVFTLLAWITYSILLWGRHRLGWRGYIAIRWTLGGFAMLMLAYFGSKLVLELILR